MVEGLYHVWFSTKGRRHALEGELRDHVKALLMETAERTGIRPIQVEVAVDHAHLLLAVTGSRTLSSAMHQLKGASARHVFLKYPGLKLDMGHNSFWKKGYGWRKITTAEGPAVRNYIRTQPDRPVRHNA